MIAVIAGHQVPGKGMLRKGKRHQTDLVIVMLQGLILPMKEKEHLMLKTIPETELILTTAIET
jgi:hypothetical protein